MKLLVIRNDVLKETQNFLFTCLKSLKFEIRLEFEIIPKT